MRPSSTSSSRALLTHELAAEPTAAMPPARMLGTLAMTDARARVIGLGRQTLSRAANRSRLARLTFARISAELQHALPDDTYGGAYFGEGRSPLGRMGLSGYNRYDRFMSNADVSAYLVWRFFPGRHTLDAGCALGFVVEALRELDLDAEGVDVSYYAVDHATAGARGHVRQGSLLDRLPFDDADFDVVTALETLEHLPPDSIPTAIAELRRVCRGYLLATIPSFGHERERARRLVQRQGARRAPFALSATSRHLRGAGSVRRPRATPKGTRSRATSRSRRSPGGRSSSRVPASSAAARSSGASIPTSRASGSRSTGACT